ncbi:hypothetical protein Gorai_019614, partial [Gossypium raimondii]|nr:hypothetical protein [Gossypium raimondii]
SSQSQDPKRDIESFQTPEQDIRSSQVPEHPRKVSRVETNEFYASSLERDPGLQNSIWDYPPNQQDEVHQAYIQFGSYQLIPLSEASTSAQYIEKNGLSGKDLGEFSSATRDRPFEGNSSVTIIHFNLTFEAPLEVAVTLKEAEVSGNDDLTSKGQIAGGKFGAGRNGKKLNKTKQDRGSHFKMSSSYRVPLPKSVNNMVELISS